MKIEVTRFFEAAHQLPDSSELITKACSRLHGHTYCVKVSAEGEKTEAGFVLDFSAIKQIVDQYDHRLLNDLIELPTTAENLATIIKGQIEEAYPFLSSVIIRLCEGYKGEQSSWVEV